MRKGIHVFIRRKKGKKSFGSTTIPRPSGSETENNAVKKSIRFQKHATAGGPRKAYDRVTLRL